MAAPIHWTRARISASASQIWLLPDSSSKANYFFNSQFRRSVRSTIQGTGSTFAFFAQDQIILLDGRLQISVAARAQLFRIRSEDRPGVLSNIDPKNSLTGDGAIAYFIRSTGTKLRAHVGNGFRAPSLFERFGNGVFQNVPTRLGDPTLRAEQSISVDGGIDQRAASDKLLLGMTYFYTHLQRVIDFKSFRSIFNPTGDPDPLGFGRSGGFLNYPGGISRGLETFVEAAPYRGTSIRAS